MSLGARINAVLGQMLLLQQGGAVDYGRDVVSQGKGGHGKHGTTSSAPVDSQPIVLEWAEWFRRGVTLAELALAMEEGTHPRPPAVRRGSWGEPARDRDQRIAGLALYRGQPPTLPAYLEGCSVEIVERARRASGLNPADGLKPEERPLTASARNQLRTYLRTPEE